MSRYGSIMIQLTKHEADLATRMSKLKAAAGSHSPSIKTLLVELGLHELQVDACFLSNPYATDLFMARLARDLLDTKKIRDCLEYYPSQNSVLAARLSEHLNVDPSMLFIGNGAIEVIQAVLHRFGGQKIVVNLPTFSSYYEFAREDQSVYYYMLKKEENFQLDIDRYIGFIERCRPDTIVIINPNNPDGSYVKRHDLEHILDNIGWVKNIVIDESFVHFAYEGGQSYIPYHHHLLDRYRNLIIIKSMSKDFGLAGLRLGYSIMSPDKVSSLLRNGYLWNSNGLAEYFVQILNDPGFYADYEKVRLKYLHSTEDFFSKISQLPHIVAYPSRANFVLIELLEGIKAKTLTAKLLFTHGVYIRNCNDKIGLEGEFVRIAARSDTENKKIIDALGQILR
jgi:histidinol-phosphate/aromatic aminotransferase/cobyric acid decarboxylase-like protein